MFKRFALAAALVGLRRLTADYGMASATPLAQTTVVAQAPVCRRFSTRRAPHRRIVQRTLWSGSTSRAAFITTRVSVGTGARSTALTLAKKRRSKWVIGRVKTGNR